MSEDKERNPQDLTVRDRQAYNKKFEKLEKKIATLELQNKDLNARLDHVYVLIAPLLSCKEGECLVCKEDK